MQTAEVYSAASSIHAIKLRRTVRNSCKAGIPQDYLLYEGHDSCGWKQILMFHLKIKFLVIIFEE